LVVPIHVKGQPGDVAAYVLLPGDPNRATYIAERFFENPVQYTDYRGLLGYTGVYNGLRVSVQTTGMGCPTTAIVLEELIQLGAKIVIRVGTCGSLKPELKPTDLVIAQGSLPFDGTTRTLLGDGPAVPLPSWRVLRTSVEVAERAGVKHHVALLATSDNYYAPQWLREQRIARGASAVEMEASAIFTVAMLRGIEAGCVCTVSNDVGDKAHQPEEVLRRGVDAMTHVALETFVDLESAHPIL
jgi:purine-nucleoside phosphorylase